MIFVALLCTGVIDILSLNHSASDFVRVFLGTVQGSLDSVIQFVDDNSRAGRDEATLRHLH